MVRFGPPDLRTSALGVKRVRGSVSPYSRGRAGPKKAHFGQNSKLDPRSTFRGDLILRRSILKEGGVPRFRAWGPGGSKSLSLAGIMIPPGPAGPGSRGTHGGRRGQRAVRCCSRSMGVRRGSWRPFGSVAGVFCRCGAVWGSLGAGLGRLGSILGRLGGVGETLVRLWGGLGGILGGNRTGTDMQSGAERGCGGGRGSRWPLEGILGRPKN